MPGSEPDPPDELTVQGVRYVKAAEQDNPAGLVYVQREGTQPFIATGEVHVIADRPISELEGEIRAKGFTVKSIPAYARHSAVLVHGSGRLAAGLLEFSNLRAIAPLQSVEPVMLSQAARK